VPVPLSGLPVAAKRVQYPMIWLDRSSCAEDAGNVVDGNDGWVVGAQPAAATWQWKNTTYHGFAAYRRATGNDAHSLLADPRLGPADAPRRDRPRSTRSSTRRWPDRSTSTTRRGARAARSTSARWSTAPGARARRGAGGQRVAAS
jgi:hypothetical protein